MTPNGEMWFESQLYYADFSTAPIEYQHLFMHEMMHVWQYQHGMNVKLRGLFSWAVNYKYDFSKNSLRQYSMEQQASIVADYWLLRKFRFNGYRNIIKYKRYDKYEDKNILIAK
ncbi:type IV secretion protein Rhs [Pantoea osteomyelitidis]|uniref:Type IV secretion protein Rhs n=1 Tax=Pantoea osteomyelitidis TaxID=3230026 RepID=A0ABW7PT13_9GAMM